MKDSSNSRREVQKQRSKGGQSGKSGRGFTQSKGVEELWTHLTESEQRLLSKLLNDAAEVFVDHGCNDFDLVLNDLFSEEEAASFAMRVLTKLYHKDEVKRRIEEVGGRGNARHVLADYELMLYFSKLFKR